MQKNHIHAVYFISPMEHVPLSWALNREVVYMLQLIIAVGSVITKPLGSAHSER